MVTPSHVRRKRDIHISRVCINIYLHRYLSYNKHARTHTRTHAHTLVGSDYNWLAGCRLAYCFFFSLSFFFPFFFSP